MKKIIFALIVLVPLLVHPTSAEAACTSFKTSGSVKVGSAISNGTVVVCASTNSGSTKTSAKVSTVKKIVTPVKVVPPPCVVKVPTAAAAYGLYLPGCQVIVVPPVVTLKNKTTNSVTVSQSTQNDQAAFTPNPIGISASPAIGSIGQPFFFGAMASAHSKQGKVLGKSAQVSFTPLNFEWSSEAGDGSGSSFSTSWSSQGSQSVSLTVTYSVSYSIGGEWIDAGQISASATASVQVVAAATPVSAPAAPPLLVSANCKDRPSTYRC